MHGKPCPADLQLILHPIRGAAHQSLCQPVSDCVNANATTHHPTSDACLIRQKAPAFSATASDRVQASLPELASKGQVRDSFFYAPNSKAAVMGSTVPSGPSGIPKRSNFGSSKTFLDVVKNKTATSRVVGARERRSEGEWHLVQRKKLRNYQPMMRIDVARSSGGRSQDSISFYFSDFSDSHAAKEMLRAFALYGKAVEVVIPPKRNRWGKRFGFVRFEEVHDPRIFAVKLDNIIFGADKIHVNLPRFEREMNTEKKQAETAVVVISLKRRRLHLKNKCMVNAAMSTEGGWHKSNL